MTNEKKRRNKKRFNLKSCLVIALGIYIIIAIILQQPQINSLEKSRAETEAMIQEKQRKSAELDDAADICSSDDYVERTARESLGLVRSDETVFVDVTGK